MLELNKAINNIRTKKNNGAEKIDLQKIKKVMLLSKYL
jgi:hypothetical protein